MIEYNHLELNAAVEDKIWGVTPPLWGVEFPVRGLPEVIEAKDNSPWPMVQRLLVVVMTK